MDSFAHLNYAYPGTPSNPSLQIPHQPQGAPHHVPVQGLQSVADQARPGDVYTCSDPGRSTQACCPPLDLAAGRGVHPQQKVPPVVPRGANLAKKHFMDDSTDMADQYVPSSSDRITCADHRPLDEIFGHVRHPSGWPQDKSGSSRLPRNGTQYEHPRYSSVLVYALPSTPQLDGVVQIPLLAVDNRMCGTGLVVDFRCSDWGIGVQVQGIPMTDLLHGNVSGLENPHQCVLDGLGLVDLRLNILWPHYSPFAKVISAFGTDGKPLTRAGLGYEVALAFAEFFYQITSQSIPPARPGPYTISSSPAGSPSPGIRYSQLHLITVRNTSRGEWAAEIRAVLIA